DACRSGATRTEAADRFGCPFSGRCGQGIYKMKKAGSRYDFRTFLICQNLLKCPEQLVHFIIGPDSDPQIIFDPRLAEVADEDVAGLEFGVQLTGIRLRMRAEQEICRRRKDGESELGK